MPERLRKSDRDKVFFGVAGGLATQRDEAAIQHWKEERWPKVEKRR